jgi:hypothetical protein
LGLILENCGKESAPLGLVIGWVLTENFVVKTTLFFGTRTGCCFPFGGGGLDTRVFVVQGFLPVIAGS